MIDRITKRNEPFIVSLIKAGQEALGDLAEPYAVGTTARIQQVETLEQGRLNVIALGMRRVKIRAISRALPYLEGEMEVWDFPDEDLSGCGDSLRRVVGGFLEMVGKTRRMPDVQLPSEPRELIFLCAAILPVSGPVRQTFLEAESLRALSRDLESRYARQVALMQAVKEGKTDGAYLN